MKVPFGLAAAALAIALAGCSPGIHGFGHSVTFQHGELVARAPQQPNAYISPDGTLRIGQRGIRVTTGQQALLKDYYDESRTITTEGEATGKAGMQLALRAIGNSVKDIFTGKSAANRGALNAEANAIKASALGMCDGVNRLRHIQQAIAAQLPEFAPYDATGGAGCAMSGIAPCAGEHRADGPRGNRKICGCGALSTRRGARAPC